jgi:ubiquinone/menaquinone biosynthesis C-methylase UbiE
MNRKSSLKPCPICDANQIRYERTLDHTDLLKCSSCGLVYANLSDERIMEFNSGYDEELAAMYEEQQTLVDALWFRRIVRKLTRMVGRGKVLDVGCGNGILLSHFLDEKWSACGVDLSPWAKKFAEQHGYELYSCELEQCELPDGCIDAITVTSTLEHIPRPYQHIREIMRVLKPGGVAYFAGIPNYGSLSVRLNVSSFRYNTPPYHVNYFTRRCMNNLFSRPGISDSVGKLSIKSYGIPELHRMHNFIRRASRKIVSGSASDEPPNTKQDSGSLSKRVLAAVSVAAYYNLGRLLHLGDKLEVIAVKRQ